jgi:hypothetical protein
VWGGRASRGEGDRAKNAGGGGGWGWRPLPRSVGGQGHGMASWGAVARIAGRQWRPSIDGEQRGQWVGMEGRRNRGWKEARRRAGCEERARSSGGGGGSASRRDRQNRAPLCSIVDAYNTHLSSSRDFILELIFNKIIFLLKH